MHGSVVPVKFSAGGIYVVELPDGKIITVGAKCFRRAEVLFQLPDGNIIIVGAKRFRCLGQCADTPRSVLLLSIGSGARVLVARSIFTVSAKRFRYAEVLFQQGYSAT